MESTTNFPGKSSSTSVCPRVYSIQLDIFTVQQLSVSLPHGATPSIPIRNGVLQGDTLSPLLSSLFMHDIDDYFRATVPNLRGVSLSHATDINCLLYADDLVLLATSPVQLTLLLRGLSSYTELNDLVINTEKSKVVVFRKGGRLPFGKLLLM